MNNKKSNLFLKKVDQILDSKPEWQGSSKSYAKAMLLAGASVEEVESKIQPYETMTVSSVLNLSCPRCNSTMQRVTLNKDRLALYCPNDRVCLPLKINV